MLRLKSTVRWVQCSASYFLMPTDWPQSQGLGRFLLGEHTSQLIPLDPDERALRPPGLVPIPSLFTSWAFPQVRYCSRFACQSSTLPYCNSLPQVCLWSPEPSRVAIWNMNKVIMAIAASLWVTNAVFLTYGESFPSMP
jgi:hypothetical protein